MLIRSQDKLALIKFDAVVAMEGEDETVEIIQWGEFINLGIYENEKRAINIINEIESCYLQGCNIYEMPID